MAIKLSVRKDWLSGTTPIRQYEPANIQSTVPVFTARQGVFQAPETPKAPLAVTPPYNAQTWKQTTTRTETSSQSPNRTFYQPLWASPEQYQSSVQQMNDSKYDRYNVDSSKFTQRLNDMAEQSTARKNRQTGLQFQSLLGGQTTKGVSSPKASPTQTAWFNVMSDSEKTRAAQIKNPVERGEFINSLNLNDRAVSQLHKQQDETAARLETKARQTGPVRPTQSPSGAAIAAYVQADSSPAKNRALDMLDTLGKRGLIADLDSLDETQKATIVSLAKSKDYQGVADYFDSIQYKILAQARESLVEKSKTLGYEHPVYSVVPEGTYNTVGGIPAILDTFAKKVEETFTHKWTPIDPNSRIYDMVAASQAIQKGANERINGRIENGRQVGGIQDPNLRRLAQLARSGTSSAITNGIQIWAGGILGQGLGIVNTAENAALANFTSNFTLGLMGTSAAGQSAYRKMTEGKTSGEALTEGLVNGFIEVITEKVSLDRLIKQLPLLTDGSVGAKELAKRWFQAFAVQGGIEGLEEVAGNIADQTWDIWYNGTDSEYSKRAQAILTQKILDNGGTEKYSPTPEDVQSAREQAFTDCFVTQSVDAFLSAVFSSFLLTGVPTATSRVSSRVNTVKAGNYLKAHGQLYSEINKATMFPGSKAAETAAALRETASQKGERNVGGYQLGRLAFATNYEVFNVLSDMAQSDNPQVAEYAVKLLNSPEIHSANLTPAKLEEILRVRREGFVTPDSVPVTASESARATAAEAERVKTENPESTVLTPVEEAIKKRFDGMRYDTVRKRAAIIQRILDGKNVTKAQFNSIDPTNAKTKEIMQELTQFPIRDGLTGDALYQEYRAIGMAVNAEHTLDIPDAPEAIEPPTMNPAEPVEAQAQEPVERPGPVESPEVQNVPTPELDTQEESRRIMQEGQTKDLETFLRRTGRLSADGQIIPSRNEFETAAKQNGSSATYEDFVNQTRSIPIDGEMYDFSKFSEWLRQNRPGTSEEDIAQWWDSNVSLYLQDGLDAVERMRQGQEQERQQETETQEENKSKLPKNGTVGNSGTANIRPNEPMKFHWAVVPVESLIISHDEYGNRNPDFPAELQPRDRTRTTSQDQINRMIQRLDPLELGDNIHAKDGAPVVRDDGTVISGNGRSAAIRAAYQRQNDSGRNYANYIRENAERFGLDPEQIPNSPVLVRVAEDVTDWAQLAKDLNVSGTAELSATEKAFTDVDRIADIIDLFRTDEEGNLNSASNWDFISAFVASVPETERNDLLDQFGEGLSQNGINRVKTAILAYAYGNSELVTRASESGNDNMKRITNALMKAAPKFAQLKADMQTGEAYDVPVIQAILNGLNLYSEALKSRSSVAEIADQASLDTSWDENAVLMAEVIQQFRGSAKKLNFFLQDLEQAVRSFGAPNQTTLLGGTENATLDTTIDRAVDQTNQRESDSRSPTNFQRRAGQFGYQLSPAENPTIRNEQQPDNESNLDSPAPDVESGEQAVEQQQEAQADDVNQNAVQSPVEKVNDVFVFRSFDSFGEWAHDQDGNFVPNEPGIRVQPDFMPTVTLEWKTEAVSKKMALVKFADKFIPALESLTETEDNSNRVFLPALDTVRRIKQDYNEIRGKSSRSPFRWINGYNHNGGWESLSIEPLRESSNGKTLYHVTMVTDITRILREQTAPQPNENVPDVPVDVEQATPQVEESATTATAATEESAPAVEHRDYSKWEKEFGSFSGYVKERLDRLPDAEKKLDKLVRETKQLKAEVMDFFGTIADTPIDSVPIQAQSYADIWRSYFNRVFDGVDVFVNEKDGSVNWSKQTGTGTNNSLVRAIFNGLASSRPDWVTASFTLGLDNTNIMSIEGARELFDYVRTGSWEDVSDHFIPGMSQAIVDSVVAFYSLENAYQNAKQASIQNLYGYLDELKDSQKKRVSNVLLSIRKGDSVTQAERIHDAVMNGAEPFIQRNGNDVSYWLKPNEMKKPQRLSKIAYDFAAFVESARDARIEREEREKREQPEQVIAYYNQYNASIPMEAERNPTLTGTLPSGTEAVAGENEETLPEGVGAASYAFHDDSVAAALDYATETYGHNKGEEGRQQLDAASEQKGVYINDIPAQMNDDTYVGQNVINQLSAPGVAKERISDYELGTVEEYFNQNPLTHEEMLNKADAEMRRHGGAYGSRDYLLDKVAKHEMLTLEDIALFQKTLVQLSHTDMSTQDYITFAAGLNDYAAYLGHGLNLLKLLQKLDPDFEMNHAQRQVGKLNEELAKKGRAKAKNQDTSDNEKAEQAADEARDEVLDEMEHPEKAARKRRRKSPGRQSGEQAADEARDEVLDDDFTQKFVEKMRKRIEQVYKRVKPTTQEQQAVKDLLRIAEGYDLPKRPTRKPRTAIDRLRAFYSNRQQFLDAWTAAQNDLRSTYENEGESGEAKIKALDGFLNKNFGYVAPNDRSTETGGTVQDPVTAGVLSAILHSDPGIAPKDVSMRAFLRDSTALEESLFKDVISQIQDFRDETGAERHIDLSESDRNEIKIAVREYIFDTYRNSLPRFIPMRDGTVKLALGVQTRLDNDIRAAVREAGLEMSKIIRQGNTDKAAVAKQINNLLLNKYGVSFDGRESAGEIIVRQFNEQVAQRARETLEQIFREKNSSKQLTANQDRILKQFTELANMGAFTSSDYHAQAAAKVFGYDYIFIDPALIAEFRNATTDTEKNAVIEKIQQNVADQIPATLGEKIVALQYMGMLGSLKTIISRNMGGNLVFQPVVATKNAVAAGIESVAKALGFEIQKTRTVTYSLKDYQAWANDFGPVGSKNATAVRRMIMQGGKYSDESTPNTFMQGVQEKRTIFGRNNDILSKSVGRILETGRRGITDIMDWGDAKFARHTYAATAARYLKAQGYTFETAPEDVKNAAREIAVREAAEATYRDNNQFSEMVSQMFFRGYHGDSKAKLFVRYLGQGILPFRKTPANVAVRAFEYSPFGIIKSGVDTVTKKFGANRMTGNDLINEWAKALTGTGLFILGMILKRWGILGLSVTGTGPLDDKKKRGFMQLGGWQAYSIRVKIGNRYRYYNADWMAPEAIPVFLGANLAESLEDNDSPDFWEVAKIAMTIGDPIIKMSMLSGVNKILTDSASYGDTEYAFTKLIANAAWSGFAQVAVPQAFLQIARAKNNTRQTTFVDKNSNVPSAIQITIGGIPFPGNANRRDYIDEWGRTQENYVTPAGNAVAQIISPSYQSIEEIDTDTRRMEQELLSLYDRTGAKSVLPVAAKPSFNLNGVEKDMTKAEFLTYATRKGQAAHKLMLELTSSPEYNALDDAQKISAVEKAYEYADGIAKLSIWGNAENPEDRYTPDKWIDSATTLSESGIPVSAFVVAKALDLKASKSTVRDSDGKAIETKVHYRKTENGKSHEKTSAIGSSSIQAALEIRQTIRFTGSDADRKYKQLFEALGISESVRGKSEQYLQQQLNKINQKGSAAP